MPVNPDLVAAVEMLALHSARVAMSPIPRKADMADLKSQWNAILDQLPPSPRVNSVTGWFAMVEENGHSFSRGVLEAIARFNLWFEGYSYARLESDS